VLLFVDDGERCECFYRDLLGLKLSDYVDIELRRNARSCRLPTHQTLAITRSASPRQGRRGGFTISCSK
jgi:catechol 2,3-dioxygenase-like lactoylglutathione lyase family enzyme